MVAAMIETILMVVLILVVLVLKALRAMARNLPNHTKIQSKKFGTHPSSR
jgi:hypothetical protein